MNTHVVGGEIRRALMGPFVLLLLLGGCVAAIYWVAMGRKPKERLTGCGSSFINPLMERWAGEYREQRVQIDYTVSGSGDGLRKLVEGKTDFACADILDAGQRKELVGAGKVLCVPLTIGAVVPVYNLPGVKQPLRFSGPVLAEIYLGKIKRWNEAPLAALNPGVKLPDLKIIPVHSGSPSGTAYLWTAYLSEVSSEWKKKVGASFEPEWPVGEGSRKAVGILGEVRGTPGALGYVEMIYSLQNREEMKGWVGLLQNREGKFVAASPESATEAVRRACEAGKGTIPQSLFNAPGKDSYPVCGFTWAVVRLDAPAGKRASLARFLHYATHEGQRLAPAKGYAPLPANVVRAIERALAALENEPRL